MNEPLPMLTTRAGVPVPLAGVQMKARLRDLFLEVELAQEFENAEAQPIEAVYTFPLPAAAVLLGVEVSLGERRLGGQVVARREAEARDEEAMVAGDTAIRLERVDSGLHAMNLGNLLPGERAVIRLRHAQLLAWNGDALRIHLPTTVAPRYGTPALAAHLVPRVDVLAQHRYGLEVRIEGLLAQAHISCPTHEVDVARGDAAVTVALREGSAFMDRDFVLNLQGAPGARSSAAAVADGEARLALLSWQPAGRAADEIRPRNLKIVVDCSGSMGGDSIAQTRLALERILDRLLPADRFEIVRFGSTAHGLFGRLAKATAAHLDRARALVREMDADLGGTEIGAALERAWRTPGARAGEPVDLLLITDGEIWDAAAVIGAARAAGQRIFTVGVGAAVAEPFVRALAEATGGACELVTPNEDMAGRIVRHFQRLRAAPLADVALRWPGTLRCQVPERLGAVFPGDTVHVFAWLEDMPDDAAAVEVSTAAGGVETFALQPPPGDDVPDAPTHPLARMAAARRIGEAPADAQALALRYQLVSEHTDFLVVDKRAEAEKAATLPELRVVPHMLAAGWGGTGSVAACDLEYCMAEPHAEALDLDMPAIPGGRALVEALLRKADCAPMSPPAERPAPGGWLPCLGAFIVAQGLPARVAQLRSLGVPDEVCDLLEVLVPDEAREPHVLLAFLHELSETPAAREALPRQARRLIARAWRDAGVGATLREAVKGFMTACLIPDL